MFNKKLEDGTAHKLPDDLKKSLLRSKNATTSWNNLTPLARNEWICWNVTVKQESTRQDHIKRTIKELELGKRRPCCWMGCVHRKDKKINATQKWILERLDK